MIERGDRRYYPDIAIPPGETVRDTLRSIGMTQTEFARRIGRPLKTVNEIIKGKTAITAETAVQFEHVLRIPARFWLNLEQNYRETRARLALLQQETANLERFPYAEMARWGWVHRTMRPTEKVQNLLTFFNVASLNAVMDVRPIACSAVAYRRSKGRRYSPEALAAWLRQGEIQAQAISVEPFDRKALERRIPEFREMTRLLPQDFKAPLVQRCASSGIALVFVPHLRHTYANGAARWLSPEKALIQLSLRYKFNDVFWFTFFHELGHLLLHGRQECFVDVEDGDPSDKEEEADRFSADILLPSNEYAAFCRQGYPTRQAVVEFAERLRIAPAIVVGRLQHDGIIEHDSLNDLRVRFTWAVETPAHEPEVALCSPAPRRL